MVLVYPGCSQIGTIKRVVAVIFHDGSLNDRHGDNLWQCSVLGGRFICTALMSLYCRLWSDVTSHGRALNPSLMLWCCWSVLSRAARVGNWSLIHWLLFALGCRQMVSVTTFLTRFIASACELWNISLWSLIWSPVMDKERMRSCQWFRSVLCVSFSALTLLVGWQEGRLACKKSVWLI